jgi:hypothetical protein
MYTQHPIEWVILLSQDTIHALYSHCFRNFQERYQILSTWAETDMQAQLLLVMVRIRRLTIYCGETDMCKRGYC